MAQAADSAPADSPRLHGGSAAPAGPGVTSTKNDQPHREASDPIQYVGPDTYILRDAAGRSQTMPGMTFEDFMAAWKRLQQLEAPVRTPRFIIEHIELTGQATGGHAELRLDATVRLLTDGPVQVPLGMGGTIPDGEPQISSADTADPVDAAGDGGVKRNSAPAIAEYVDFDRQRGGLVARFVGHVNERRAISVKLLVPLSRDGSGTTLAFTCPRSVSSKLSLDVGAQNVEASVSSGAVVAHELKKEGTRLVVAGIQGPSRLTWQTPATGAAEFTSVLSAESAIHVAIDGRSVRCDARLAIQSYGGSFDRLRIRLPQGAQLIRGEQSEADASQQGYRLSIEPDGAQSSPDERKGSQVVVVELQEKQRGPVVVHLTTEQRIELAETASAMQLAGFEVLGAVRQFGDIALEVAPDWQARWEIGSFVRQVNLVELEPTLQQPNVTAAFQYDRQPWSLGVQVAERKLRVLVTPEYGLNCSTDEARLAVRLTYQVLSGRAFEFQVDLKGWEVTADPIVSGGLIDLDEIHVTESGILVLPLAQAASRRAEVAFSLKRVLTDGTGRIRLSMPVPFADSVGPADLIVRAESGIEVIPDATRSLGLLPSSSTEPTDKPARSSGVEYRFRVSTPDAVFAAERVVRAREVAHTDVASIFVDGATARVEQQIAYVVRNQSIRELTFEVPQELAIDDSRMAIAIVANPDDRSNDEHAEASLSLTPLVEETIGVAGRAVHQFRVLLPQPRLNRLLLKIEYRYVRPGTVRVSAWRLPLIRPSDGVLESQQAVVHFQRPFMVALDQSSSGSSWRAAGLADRAGARSPLTFVSDRGELYLPLALRVGDVIAPSATTVDRVWLQSWMTNQMRQDRAAFRFHTAASQVAVELAPQTPDIVEVLLDGKPARNISRAAGRIAIGIEQLPAVDGAADQGQPTGHTLELRFRVPMRFAVITRHSLTPPQMIGINTLTEAYWQVVLPGDKHVIRSPAQWEACSQWQWLNGFWGRGPTRSQTELEQWAGASPQIGPAPADAQYLYTGLTPLSTVRLITAPRWLVVLGSSTSVLSLVLACVYFPAMRRPWILGAIACAIAGLALVFPVASLLLAQASLLGTALGAVALAIARLVARPTPWRVAVPGSAPPRGAAPRSDPILIPSVVTTGSTSPTVPVGAPGVE